MVYKNILIEVEYKDMEFKTPLAIHFNFGRQSPPIGTAYLERRPDGIYATIETRYNLTGFTPAVGFTHTKMDLSDAIIDTVGMCKARNVDERIKPIK